MAGWAIYILAVKRNVLKTGEQYLMKFLRKARYVNGKLC